jgi:hypothetical protein
MIASAHIVSGIVSGVVGASARTKASRFAVAFALGLVSHVVLDAIPHSDYGQLFGAARMAVVIVEVPATAALMWFMLRSRWRPGFGVSVPAGLAGSVLPDAKFAFALFPEPVASSVERWGNGFHSWFHALPTPFLVGMAAQIASLMLLLVILTLMLRRVPIAPPAAATPVRPRQR